MYPVSEKYKEQMRAPIRECRSLARIYMGVFDATASADAALTTAAAVAYAVPGNINRDAGVVVSYATFEGDYYRLDGSQMLLPDNAGEYLPQGWISEAISGADGIFSTPPQVIISFGAAHTMVGLTLTFGGVPEDAPAQLSVLSYRDGELINTHTVTEGLEPVCKAELLLEEIDKIVLQYDRTRAPYGRARLAHIEFGIGYSYQNREILQISEKHTDAPVSTSLPSSSLSFDLDNEDDRFGVDSDTALVRFFAEGQTVQVDYGIEVDGEPEWIPGGKWYLTTWKTDGGKATFSADGLISRLTKTTYEKGIYDWSWHGMYDLAKAVLEDAGLSDYYVDPYLRTTGTMAPLPICSHAEALQLLANRGRARLYEDRQGRIAMEVLLPQTEYTYLSPPQTVPQMPYSNVTTLDRLDNVIYQTAEEDFALLDGSQVLLPDDGGYIPSGWTGANLPAPDLSYTDASVSIKFAYPTNVYQLYIDWGGPPPSQVRLTYNSSDPQPQKLKETFLSPTKERETYPVSCPHCDRINIELQKASARVRPRIRALVPSRLSDFVFGRDQIFNNPKAEMLTKLRRATTEWTWRSKYRGVTVDLYSAQMNTNQGWMRIEHEIALDPAAVVNDSTVTVEAQHYAYVSMVRLTSATTKEVELRITGAKLCEIQHPIASEASDSGEDLPVTNPLFDAENAQITLDWMRDYYARRVRYEIETRGFPELDCGDYVYLWDGSAAQIIGTELTYNGSFREKFTLRK